MAVFDYGSLFISSARTCIRYTDWSGGFGGVPACTCGEKEAPLGLSFFLLSLFSRGFCFWCYCLFGNALGVSSTLVGVRPLGGVSDGVWSDSLEHGFLYNKYSQNISNLPLVTCGLKRNHKNSKLLRVSLRVSLLCHTQAPWYVQLKSNPTQDVI